MSARAERLRAKVAAERALPPSERLANMLHATHTTADAKALLDAYRDAVLAEERPIHRVEVLAEVAERLREADEQAAAVLVDWLMEGESRG